MHRSKHAEIAELSEVSAYHEAGHAFMAILVGARIRCVTIEPGWDNGPARWADIQVEWPLDQFTDREFREKSVQVALAGPVTEVIVFPGSVGDNATCVFRLSSRFNS